jgi:hypothetical protein
MGRWAQSDLCGIKTEDHTLYFIFRLKYLRIAYLLFKIIVLYEICIFCETEDHSDFWHHVVWYVVINIS